ncbi:MAG: TolC family outer membrane protein [Pseudomonadota bacterium]
MRHSALSIVALIVFGAVIGGAQSASAETLGDAIASAYQRNPTLLAERKARAIADENLKQAKSQRLPQVSLTSSLGLEETETTRDFGGGALPGFGDQSNRIASAGIEARQSLYAGGRIAAGVRQARAGVDSADGELEAASQSLILDVVTAYVDVISDEASHEIRKNNVNVLEQQLQAASDRFDVGEVTRTDVAQAEARLSGAEADLAASRAQLESTRALFAELVGRAPVQLEPYPPAPGLPAELEEAIELALAANPSLAASRASEAAAEQAVKVARGQLRPNVDLVGAAGVQETNSDDTFRDSNASLTAQFQMPLFQGGLLRSQVRSAKLQYDQARLQTQAIERSLIANVSRAWYNVISANRAIESSRRQVAAAEIAFEGAEQELSVGLRTTLDVLDQEQELLEARLGFVLAERTAYVATHQLLQSLGGLTPEALAVNTPLYDPDVYSQSLTRN